MKKIHFWAEYWIKISKAHCACTTLTPLPPPASTTRRGRRDSSLPRSSCDSSPRRRSRRRVSSSPPRHRRSRASPPPSRAASPTASLSLLALGRAAALPRHIAGSASDYGPALQVRTKSDAPPSFPCSNQDHDDTHTPSLKCLHQVILQGSQLCLLSQF
jgi:hypothetical protein